MFKINSPIFTHISIYSFLLQNKTKVSMTSLSLVLQMDLQRKCVCEKRGSKKFSFGWNKKKKKVTK